MLLVLGAHLAWAEAADLQIAGQASMTTDAPVQKNSRFELKAQFVAAVNPALTAPAHGDDRFALFAQLSTSSLVCYNDTIFRDSVDGTGL